MATVPVNSLPVRINPLMKTMPSVALTRNSATRISDRANIRRPGQLLFYGTDTRGRQQFFQLGLTRTISPNLINEARAGVNRTLGAFDAVYFTDVSGLNILTDRTLAGIWNITSPGPT